MRWTGILIVAGAALSLAACSTYPAEPRYPIRPMSPGGMVAPPPAGSTPSASETWSDEPPPPARAPIERIDGGSLPPPAATASPPPPAYYPPASGAPSGLAPGAAYVIQPGDTLSGVGRRFQTPVQVLIDLNGLGPRGAIASGQRVILPDSAVDTGVDPYATGASPVGVLTPNDGPPPPPPPGNTALPPPARTPAAEAPRGADSVAVAGLFQWPVRGDIVRRFGPVGLGERNNGINIAAPAGSEVRAAAAGRVAYVGDDLVGQGLTVLIVHRDGWRTVYGHLGSATVRDGDEVRQGQGVGTVGLTAGDGRPSMHFETRNMRNDEPVPIDPLTVLPR